MTKKLLSLTMIMFLSACSFPGDSSENSNGGSSLEPAPQALVLDGDYGVKTATAASLLTDAINFQPQLQGPAMARRAMTEEEEAAAIDKVHDYLGIMNQLLEDNPVQTEVLESDREGYAFKVVVTTTGLDGTTSVFTMYFNTTLLEEESTSSEGSSSEETSSEEASSEDQSSGEESISDEPSSSEETSSEESSSVDQPSGAKRSSDDDHDEDEEDDEEEEREEIDDDYDTEDSETEDIDDEDRDEYEDHRNKGLGDENEDGEVATISGIAIVGDIEYQLLGFSSTEGDEVKTRYFLMLDEQNWIRISSKTETDESKYDVLMKANGEVSRMSFKIEQDEDNKTKVSLFVKSESGQAEMYKFSRLIDDLTGDQYIKIEARVDGVKFKARVVISTDEFGDIVYTYKFEGSDKEHDRDGHRDYHDDDDDHDEEDD